MDQEYTSTELYHFVGRASPQDHESNWTTLSSVLRDGCISHPPHDREWGGIQYTIYPKTQLDQAELVVPEMTCFCDIPRASLGVHCAKYGLFGLSIERDHLIKYGARPVTYFPIVRGEDNRGLTRRLAFADIQGAYLAFHQYVESTQELVASRDFEDGRIVGETRPTLEAVAVMDTIVAKDFLAFIKPFDANLDRGHDHNYYMEREWRKFGNVLFEPEHIQRVVVAEGFGARAEKDLPAYKDKIEEIPEAKRRKL